MLWETNVFTSTFKFHCQINFILCPRTTPIPSGKTTTVTYRLSYLLLYNLLVFIIVLNPRQIITKFTVFPTERSGSVFRLSEELDQTKLISTLLTCKYTIIK